MNSCVNFAPPCSRHEQVLKNWGNVFAKYGQRLRFIGSFWSKVINLKHSTAATTFCALRSQNIDSRSNKPMFIIFDIHILVVTKGFLCHVSLSWCDDCLLPIKVNINCRMILKIKSQVCQGKFTINSYQSDGRTAGLPKSAL